MRKFALIFFFFYSFNLVSQNTCGTTYQSGQELNGYTLFGPGSTTSTFLIDNCGRVVNEWNSVYKPGLSMKLLENGNLLRCTEYPNSYFNIAGQGGRIEIVDWNSNILWEYVVSDSNMVQHHDIEYLPNGNIIVLAAQRKTPLECYNAGRDTVNLMSEGEIFEEFLMELQPIGADSAIVVWEWHTWDHLIQDFNPVAANYGIVAEHPELINVNYVKNQPKADWAHANSVFYNSDIDQLVVSFNSFNEFLIIDHSTTTSEAASNVGGNMGKGGDVLFRYGNPLTYNHITNAGPQNEGQHTVHWIPNGLKDAGKILFYNNGNVRGYSTVEIIDPLTDVNGNYLLEADTTFGPDTAEWVYGSASQNIFFSGIISSAQRLSNGNTLICEGREGRFFEIDSLDNTVWEYVNPINNSGIMTQGDVPPAGRNVFRAEKYLPSYPGLSSQNLTPGVPIELNPDLSGCISSSIEIYSEVNYNIYPNPTLNNINIEVKNDLIGQIGQVHNSLGQLIDSFIISSNYFSLELNKPGVYFISINGISKKVIKY